MRQQDQLSGIQVMILVASTILGTTVLSLPRTVTKEAGIGGVVATLFTGILTFGLTVIITLLSKRYPNQTVIEYSVEILGTIPGKIYGAIFVIYAIFVSGGVIRAFADALKIHMLPNTPLEIIMISMLIVVVYAAMNGISVLAKTNETFYPLVFFALLLLLVLSLPRFRMDEFRALLFLDLPSVVKAIPQIIASYLGFEIMFFLVPFARKPKKVLLYSVAGIFITSTIYTALVVISIGVLGLAVTQKLVYPAVILAKHIEFPGSFAERFDIFFMVLWILAAFTTLESYCYLSAFSLTRLIGLRNYKPFIFLLLPVIYMIAILPQNIYQIEMLLSVIGLLGSFIVFAAIPMFFISLARKKGERKNA